MMAKGTEDLIDGFCTGIAMSKFYFIARYNDNDINYFLNYCALFWQLN